MRNFFAPFLLAIIILQGVASHVGVGVWQIVGTGYQMNAEESAISAGLKEEAGIESAIQILLEEQLTPRGYIYSDFFAFHGTDGGGQVYYRLVPDDTEEYAYVHHAPAAPGATDPDWAFLLEHLFRDFTVTQFEWPMISGDPLPGAAHFTVHTLRQQHWAARPSPPPDRV